MSSPSSLSIFSPTLMHLSSTPDLPKLLPSLILFPKHTQSLLFAVVCAFLWHPQSSWSSSSYSSPPTVTGENKSSPSLAVACFSALKPALCFQLPTAMCVAGFNKPWQVPSTSYWLRLFFGFFFSMFVSHYSANEWPLSREKVDKISPHYFQRNWLVKKAGQSCAENSVFQWFWWQILTCLCLTHCCLVRDKAHGKFIFIYISSLTETSGISPDKPNFTWRTMITKQIDPDFQGSLSGISLTCSNKEWRACRILEWFGLEGAIKIIQFHPPAMERDTFPGPSCPKPHLTWPATLAGMGCQQGIKARKNHLKFRERKLGFFRRRGKSYMSQRGFAWKNSKFFWGRNAHLPERWSFPKINPNSFPRRQVRREEGD